MTLIYDIKYVFGLPPVSGPELLKPLEFPVMRVIKVVFVILMRSLWKAPLDGAGCPENQPCY